MEIIFPESGGNVTADILRRWAEAVREEPLSALGLLHVTEDGTAMSWLCYHAGKLPKDVRIHERGNCAIVYPYTSPVLSGADARQEGYDLKSVNFPKKEIKEVQRNLESASNVLFKNFSRLVHIQDMPEPFLQTAETLRWHFRDWKDIVEFIRLAENFWYDSQRDDVTLMRMVLQWEPIDDKMKAVENTIKTMEWEQSQFAKERLKRLRELCENLTAPPPRKDSLKAFIDSVNKLYEHITADKYINWAYGRGLNLKECIIKPKQPFGKVYPTARDYYRDILSGAKELVGKPLKESNLLPTQKEQLGKILEELEENCQRL